MISIINLICHFSEKYVIHIFSLAAETSTKKGISTPQRRSRRLNSTSPVKEEPAEQRLPKARSRLLSTADKMEIIAEHEEEEKNKRNTSFEKHEDLKEKIASNIDEESDLVKESPVDVKSKTLPLKKYETTALEELSPQESGSQQKEINGIDKNRENDELNLEENGKVDDKEGSTEELVVALENKQKNEEDGRNESISANEANGEQRNLVEETAETGEANSVKNTSISQKKVDDERVSGEVTVADGKIEIKDVTVVLSRNDIIASPNKSINLDKSDLKDATVKLSKGDIKASPNKSINLEKSDLIDVSLELSKINISLNKSINLEKSVSKDVELSKSDIISSPNKFSSLERKQIKHVKSPRKDTMASPGKMVNLGFSENCDQPAVDENSDTTLEPNILTPSKKTNSVHQSPKFKIIENKQNQDSSSEITTTHHKPNIEQSHSLVTDGSDGSFTLNLNLSIVNSTSNKSNLKEDSFGSTSSEKENQLPVADSSNSKSPLKTTSTEDPDIAVAASDDYYEPMEVDEPADTFNKSATNVLVDETKTLSLNPSEVNQTNNDILEERSNSNKRISTGNSSNDEGNEAVNSKSKDCAADESGDEFCISEKSDDEVISQEQQVGIDKNSISEAIKKQNDSQSECAKNDLSDTEQLICSTPAKTNLAMTDNVSNTDSSAKSKTLTTPQSKECNWSGEKKTIESRIDDLIKKHEIEFSDSETSVGDFVDAEAEEGEEDTPSEDSNQIIEEGETINTTSSEYGSSDEYEKDSFLTDEEINPFVSGDEYEVSDTEEKKKKKKKSSRIIRPTESDDEESTAEAKKDLSIKESPQSKSRKSRIIRPTKSSDEEEIESENKNSADDDTKTENKHDSTVEIQTPKELRKSVSILENVKIEEIKSQQLIDQISVAVEKFFAEVTDDAGEVKINLSLDYSNASVIETEGDNSAVLKQTRKKRKDRSLQDTDKYEMESSVFTEILQPPSEKKRKSTEIVENRKEKWLKGSLSDEDAYKGSKEDVADQNSILKKKKKKSKQQIKKLHQEEPEKDVCGVSPTKNKRRDRQIINKSPNQQEEVEADELNIENGSKRKMKTKVQAHLSSDNEMVHIAESKRKQKKRQQEMEVEGTEHKKRRPNETDVTNIKQKKALKGEDSKISKILPSKQALVENMKVEYFPNNLLKKIVDQEEKRKRSQRPSLIITPDSNAESAWEIESTSPPKPSKASIVVTKKLNKSKDRKNTKSIEIKPSTESSVHPKDFKTKVLFSRAHVNRMDTKTLMKKKLLK